MFEYCFDVAILLNTASLTVQAERLVECGRAEDGSGALVTEGGCYLADDIGIWVEPFFTFLFLGEVIVKAGVYSPKDYLASKSNLFDFVVTIVSLLLWLLLSIFASNLITPGDPHEADDYSGWLQLILIVRLARVIRLLTDFPRFRVIFATLTSLVPKFSTLMLMVFTLFYIFSAIGVAVFGGFIFEDNLVLSPGLKCPDFTKTPWDRVGQRCHDGKAFGTFHCTCAGSSTCAL